MREWCSKCGNPDPFAWFRRFRAIAVVSLFAVSLLLSLLANERNKSLEGSVRESGRSKPLKFQLVRHAGQ